MKHFNIISNMASIKSLTIRLGLKIIRFKLRKKYYFYIKILLNHVVG